MLIRVKPEGLLFYHIYWVGPSKWYGTARRILSASVWILSTCLQISVSDPAQKQGYSNNYQDNHQNPMRFAFEFCLPVDRPEFNPALAGLVQPTCSNAPSAFGTWVSLKKKARESNFLRTFRIIKST